MRPARALLYALTPSRTSAFASSGLPQPSILTHLARRFPGSFFASAAVAVPVTVVIASLAGFALATSEGRVQRLLIVLTVGAMMVPVAALWVPRAVLFKWLGLTDTLPVLMLPALMGTTPFFNALRAYSQKPTGVSVKNEIMVERR